MNFANLTQAELMELLSTYTSRFTVLLKNGAPKIEQQEIKKIVDSIIDEISKRNLAGYNSLSEKFIKNQLQN